MVASIVQANHDADTAVLQKSRHTKERRGQASGEELQQNGASASRVRSLALPIVVQIHRDYRFGSGVVTFSKRLGLSSNILCLNSIIDLVINS